MISFGPVESKSNGYFIRSYHVAKYLAKLHHKVFVLEFPNKIGSSVESELDTFFVHLKGNEVYQNKIMRLLRNALSFDPFTMLRFQLRSLLELYRYRDYLITCDLVFVEGALILSAIVLSRMLHKTIVLDTHCVNKLLALNFRTRNSLVYFSRTILWDLLERYATRHSNYIIAVSKKEQLFIQKEYRVHESRLFVVPNVIDLPRPIPNEKVLALRKNLTFKGKTLVIFIGNLISIQNKDAVEYILNILAPFFWQKRRDVLFLIVGKGKEAFTHHLPNVLFTGFVEDVTPFIAISDVCVAPLRVGSGVKTKVLEYMAYGRYIVTTPIGVEGLEEYVDLFPIHVSSIDDFKETLLTVVNQDKTETQSNVAILLNVLYNSFASRLEDILYHVKLSMQGESTQQQQTRS